MYKVTTINKAWEDFFLWIKQQDTWRQMTRQQQQYIYRADLAKRDGKRIDVRIKTLLEKYGEGRYEFRDVVIIHDEK